MNSNETKNQIISTASILFAKYGYYKTSIDEIAKMSRRAKGSIYYHFRTKEELFTAVVASELDFVKADLEIIVRDNTLAADEKLKSFLRQRMVGLYQAKNYHETLHNDFFNELKFLKELRKDWDEWIKDHLSTIINQGIKEGLFEDIPELTPFLDIFVMVSRGLEVPFFLQGYFDVYNSCFDGMLKMLIKGLKK